MPIQSGEPVPNVTIKEATAEGANDVDLVTLSKGKKVIVFTLPGAFTPTCSKQHLPGFVARHDELKAKGVDVIACLSVNDVHVMRAWAREHDALGKIVMLADGNAALTRALGFEADLSAFGMGVRCRRGALTIVDGIVERVDLEEPGKLEVSSAEACLARS